MPLRLTSLKPLLSSSVTGAAIEPAASKLALADAKRRSMLIGFCPLTTIAPRTLNVDSPMDRSRALMLLTMVIVSSNGVKN